MLSELYLKIGRYDDALKLATAGLARQPKPGAAPSDSGPGAHGSCRSGGGAKGLSAAAKADPKSAEARYFQARAYAGLGRKTEAEAAYRESIRLNPAFQAAKTELAALTGERPRDGPLVRESQDSRNSSAKARDPDVPVRGSSSSAHSPQRRSTGRRKLSCSDCWRGRRRTSTRI